LIPVNDLKRHNALLQDRLAASLGAVLEGGWFILGPHVRQFEATFATFCGVTNCIGVANGTDALELALRALAIGPQDQVATVANAGGYSTAAILATSAEPLYLEIEPATLLMDVVAAGRSVTPRTRAIIATHLYGRMVDMPALAGLAARRGIPVVEDCAQAHGASIDGRQAGAWGTLGCFSFYPTKNLGALGDAGAVVTDDTALAGRVRQLRQYGWKSRFVSDLSGRNSRLDDLQAAVLSAKLPYLDGWNQRRRSIAQRYDDAFQKVGIEMPRTKGPESVAHLYVIRAACRDALRAKLAERGIATDVHYPLPDYRQPSARGFSWANVSLPLTEACCADVLTLPCFPEMTDEEVEAVIGVVRGLL
jgi:aminotransferase EvaB